MTAVSLSPVRTLPAFSLLTLHLSASPQALSESLEAVSLYGCNVRACDLAELASGCPALRHLRLLHCRVSDTHLAALQSLAGRRLATLVLKEAPSVVLGTLGFLTGFEALESLAVSTDAEELRPLGCLARLRHLALDARGGCRLAGGLRHVAALPRLRHVLLPLLQLHQVRCALQSACRLRCDPNAPHSLTHLLLCSSPPHGARSQQFHPRLQPLVYAKHAKHFSACIP